MYSLQLKHVYPKAAYTKKAALPKAAFLVEVRKWFGIKANATLTSKVSNIKATTITGRF